MSIRKRYGSGGWQVQVAGFPAVTVPTKTDARRMELDYRRRRALGEAYEGPALTLGETLDGFIEAKQALGGLSPRGIEFLVKNRRFWRPFDEVRLTGLRRQPLEDALVARAAVHPRSAKAERELLLAALRWAHARGQRVDVRLYALPTVQHRPRRGRALTVAQVWELTSWFPEHVRRLVPLAGFVGARQHFWLALTDAMLDLDDGRMVLPAELQKNRREHMIYLSEVEVRLLREQLLARPAGTALVFPTVTGRAYNRHSFRERVWADSLAAAAERDPVFAGFTFHMLRHTAGSLMAAAGCDASVAAERMGHTDGGGLFLRTYRHLYEGERRLAVTRFGATIERPAEGASLAV